MIVFYSLVCEEAQGDACLTNFHGMELTRDKQCAMIKKWQTKIEAHVDVTSTDGYKLRLFCVGFTKKRQNQVKKTTYAQSTQVRVIRKKMMDIMRREVNIKKLARYNLAHANKNSNSFSRSRLRISDRLLPNFSRILSLPTSPKPLRPPTPFMRFMCVKSRSSRSPSSTCRNCWRCTANPARSSKEVPRTVKSLIIMNPLCSRAFNKTFC